MSAYPLQALLDLREQAKGEAERGLAAAVHALAQEEARRDEAAAALTQARAEREAQVQAHLSRTLSQGADAAALSLMGQHTMRLKDAELARSAALAAQEAAVSTAQGALQQRQAALVEAARELQLLEQHRERWEAERRRAREVREEQAQEEVAAARHLARRRE
jgi:hypothetical protein